MSTTYDRRQVIFCLSMFSNMASSTKGDTQSLQALLVKRLNQALTDQKVIDTMGLWKVVWGPVVHLPVLGDQVANALFVAEYQGSDPTYPKYVIATSGTNPESLYGWLVEDLQVRTQYPWPYYNGQPAGLTPKISEGTKKGIDILTEKMVSDGKRLIPFLQDLMATQPTLVDIAVAGHSLGGALSATLALQLKNTQNNWDPGQKAVVYASPSAGPTPGNADFATYYDDNLASTTDRIWNVKDVVPHAWEVSMLLEIPNLYNPPLDPPLWFTAFIGWIVYRTEAGNYKQLVGQGNTLPGAYNPSWSKGSSFFEQFFTQLGNQHTTAYKEMLGVNALLTYVYQLVGVTTVDKTDYAAEEQDAKSKAESYELVQKEQ